TFASALIFCAVTVGGILENIVPPSLAQSHLAQSRRIVVGPFSIAIPQGAELRDVSRKRADFRLFNVVRGDQLLLMIYLGNAPSAAPMKREPNQASVRSVKNIVGARVQIESTEYEALYSKQAIFILDKIPGRAEFIDAVYVELALSDAAEMDAVI